jgi:thymidylate kinase
MSHKKYFIVEGENSTGKSTLVDGLSKKIQDITIAYSVPEEFEELRQNAYSAWSNEASLFYYISANFEMLNKIKSDFVIFDRSIISTFSIYLSRLPEDEWSKVMPIFTFFLKFMPKISNVILLTASNIVIKQRINQKSKKEMHSDLKEIDWEEKKAKARMYLLERSKWNIIAIDTSFLSAEDVLKQVVTHINSRENIV